ncbi:MAG: acyltransferase [Devosia sp.]|nr:acyltransferase [Devosia sp.]
MVSPLSPTANRLYGADFLRAAACLMVMLHHISQRMGDADFGVLSALHSVTVFGTFGVGIFFVLSGFLLAHPFWLALDAQRPLPSLRIYASRRAARILPGFWLALTITFILSITLFGVAPNAQLIIRYLAGVFIVADWHWVTLFPVEINSPLWSISFEISSYVMLPLGFAALFLLRPFTGTGWLARLPWLAVIGIALLLHWAFITFYPIDDVDRGWGYGLVGGAKSWMPHYNPFAFFAMFAVGGLAAGVQTRLAGLRHWAFDLIGLIGLGIVVSRLTLTVLGPSIENGLFGIPYDFPIFTLGIATPLAALPSSVVLGPLLDNRPIRYLATISFGIYVWHYLVIELARILWFPGLSPYRMTDVAGYVVAAPAIIVVTMLIAHLSFRYLENPVIQWARHRERREPKP